MIRFLLILILTPAVNDLAAQTIKGKVIDANTLLPLHHTHIACPQTGEGTITDESGNFTFILDDTRQPKTLVASFVGYQTISKSIESPENHFVLKLQPDTTLLKSVDIMAPDPVELIRSALSRIKENHGDARLLTCFYRMETKNQDKYIQVSEAAFELNQSPGKYNQIKVLKTREAEDDKAFNGVGMGIGTPLSAAKNFDITIHPEASFLSQKNMRKYNFFYEGTVIRSGVEAHEISFDQKKIKQALFRGKIYLHTSTLAIVGLTYGLSPKGIPYFNVGNAAERAAMKLLNISIEVQAHDETITYRQFGNKWYPDHLVRNEKVRVKSRRYNFDVPVTDRSEFLITRIDTNFNRPFHETELATGRFLESPPDPAKSFWEDHNIIPSQFNYEDIAREIESRNGYSQMKMAVKEKIKIFPKETGIRVDCVLTYYHNKSIFNGTALIKHKGKVVLHKGYGYADKELQLKNDTSTIFRIGSIAKTFTSRVIWQLKQEGLLDYDDSVQRFVPWYPYHGITIHHLLTHSSGIPNYMEQANFIDSIQHTFTIEELIRHFGLEQPVFSPGSQFQYSNTGYTLLALIAEKASGKNFNDLLTEKIIKPLRLTTTSFGNSDHPSQAKGYFGNVLEPKYVLSNTAGAGAISSTASNLLKWDNAHDDPALDELFEPHTWYHDWGAHYGYGWNIDKYQFRASKKHTIHYHGGTDFGFKSIIARQPDKDNLVILLNNTGEFPLFDISDLVFDILN